MPKFKFAFHLVAVVVALSASGVCQSTNPLPSCESSSTLLANLKTIYDNQFPTVNTGQFVEAAFWLQQGINAEIADAKKKEPANKASAAEKRTDEQTTAPSGASGSTSAASKGSVPWLLGLAEEYGGLTESTSGSVSTFKGNVTNIIKAVDKKNFETSYNAWPNRPMLAAVEKASFSIGFNTGTSGSSTSTSPNPSGFNSATAHIDIYNHRDPRDKRWSTDWQNVLNKDPNGNVPIAAAKLNLGLAKGPEYQAWQQDELALITSLVNYQKATTDPQTTKDSKISDTLKQMADDYGKDICTPGLKSNETKQLFTGYSEAYAHYSKNEQAVVDEINNSPVFSFEYTFTNQGSVQLPKSTTQTYAIGTIAPNLSNFNFIYQGSLSKTKSGLQLTANASATLYTNASSQLKLTPVRDFKLTTELDIPVPALAGFAKSTISLSALYQDLLQEPLGQQVTVNSVAVSNTGNVVLGQAKWTFAAGTSGISFPVSFTASNRTTLIKETDVKGTVGISYNLDNLFAQKSQ
jgi:hypothetical protein